MNILVIGGTRFFGIPMVKALIKKSHDITIATRGNLQLDFYDNTSHVTLDRTDETSIKNAIGGQHFDVIIDKIAYSSNDVKNLLEHVTCDKYIQMSTCSVYPKCHENITEDEFDTPSYPLRWIDRISDYQETKRQAERAVLEYLDSDRYSFVRYPVVMGENDYTGRLRFYVDHIKEQKPMFIDDIDRHLSFINEDEAGLFIAHLVDHFISGPVNGCSRGSVTISDIISYIEKKSGRKALLSDDGESAPYNGYSDNNTFSTDKAGSTGFVFSHIDDWIYPLLDHYIEN
ncbi:MAG: NAD-dependent epimerase/dehydratase family protein [Lachnospiraceae bacterium]|nr:NAD-dependent epimerase/dehydratase family protein [Lachnospiraceae bacterium]